MTWNRIQSKSAVVGSGSSVAATFGTPLSAGSKLIAFVTSDLTTVSTVKDTAGNSFSLVAGPTTSSSEHLYVYVLDTPGGDAGATTTITATLAGTTDATAILIQEVSGLAGGTTAAAVLDGTAGTLTGSNATGSTFATGTPSYTSTAQGEYLVSVYGDNGDGPSGCTFTAPSGYTADPNCVSGTTQGTLAVSWKNSTDGTESDGYSITPSSASTDLWSLILVAFTLQVPYATRFSQRVATVPFRAGR